jgi:DNA-directed RNA polymerase specialized sigma24 family protein
VPVAELPDRAAAAGDAEPVDEQLWSAVRALADKQREAVAYRYIGDLSYARIGEAMGISEAAARRNAADGIRALRARRADTRKDALA